MGMTWEEIEKQPKSKHNALVRLYKNELVEECLQEHEKKSKVDKDDFLEYFEGSKETNLKKDELDTEVEKYFG